jgi:ribosomal protein S18 acetylase RimI-like enzyme
MRPDDLKVRRVNSVCDPAFEGLMRIYLDSHPQCERKSPALLSTMIEDPGYFFLAAADQNAVVGFTIVRAFSDSDAALLEYMAVAHDHRNHGIGQYLFAETAKFDVVSSRFLLAEVDSDKTAAADQKARTRRKAFYRGLGCREIDQLRYIMPPVSTEAPPEMDVLVYKRDLPESIERARIRQWLVQSYIDVYGMSANDPRIEIMTCGLCRDVRLI